MGWTGHRSAGRPSDVKDAYFQETDAGFVPEARAHGPWAEDMMHGRLLGGLAARELERLFGDPEWRVTRLTVDLFRPAPMEAVQIATTPVREGRKVKVIDAMITCAGHQVGRVTAVFLIAGQEPDGEIWRPDHAAWPAPDSLAGLEGTGDAEADLWLFRVVEGGMGTGKHSSVWTNDTGDLIQGESMSPVVRAAVSGDIACPLANFSDQGLHYINADYTMLLGRYPEGDWIGLEVTEQIQSDGVSAATATLRDERGAFAVSGGTSLVRPPLDD